MSTTNTTKPKRSKLILLLFAFVIFVTYWLFNS